MIRLLLQACANDGLPADVATLIEHISEQCDGWMAYKIGRQASRFGHHSLAASIFAQLTLAVSGLIHSTAWSTYIHIHVIDGLSVMTCTLIFVSDY